MVERTTTSGGLEQFVGFARKIDEVEGAFGKQIEIKIEPADKTILKNSKTGFFFTWLRLSATATEKSIPEGSVLDLYLKEVEGIFKDAKKEETIMKALGHLLDKKVLYRKKHLGKSFEGKEPGEQWVPVTLA